MHSLFSVDNSFLLQLIVISYLLEELDGLGAMWEARLVDSPAKGEGAREIWEMRLILSRTPLVGWARCAKMVLLSSFAILAWWERMVVDI